MSATVHVLPTKSALDKAWDDYAALVRASMDDETLRLDRAHMEATIRAGNHFRQLFTDSERAR